MNCKKAEKRNAKFDLVGELEGRWWKNWRSYRIPLRFLLVFLFCIVNQSSRERISCRFDGGGNNMFEKNLKLFCFFSPFSLRISCRTYTESVSRTYGSPLAGFGPSGFSNRLTEWCRISPRTNLIYSWISSPVFSKNFAAAAKKGWTPLVRNVVGRRVRVFPTRYFSPHDAGGGAKQNGLRIAAGSEPIRVTAAAGSF